MAGLPPRARFKYGLSTGEPSGLPGGRPNVWARAGCTARHMSPVTEASAIHLSCFMARPSSWLADPASIVVSGRLLLCRDHPVGRGVSLPHRCNSRLSEVKPKDR